MRLEPIQELKERRAEGLRLLESREVSGIGEYGQAGTRDPCRQGCRRGHTGIAILLADDDQGRCGNL